MSASRIKHKFVQTLDFNKPKLSRRYVARVLKNTPFDGIEYDARTGNITCLEHEVKVGMYKIHIFFPPTAHLQSYKYLRDYKKMHIEISTIRNESEVYLIRDKLFTNQKWVHKNHRPPNHRGGWIQVNDLITAIIYCNKISNLKAFL